MVKVCIFFCQKSIWHYSCWIKTVSSDKLQASSSEKENQAVCTHWLLYFFDPGWAGCAKSWFYSYFQVPCCCFAVQGALWRHKGLRYKYNDVTVYSLPWSTAALFQLHPSWFPRCYIALGLAAVWWWIRNSFLQFAVHNSEFSRIACLETSAFPYAIKTDEEEQKPKGKANPREKPSALSSPPHRSLPVVTLWAPDLARNGQLSFRRKYFAIHRSPSGSQ